MNPSVSKGLLALAGLFAGPARPATVSRHATTPHHSRVHITDHEKWALEKAGWAAEHVGAEVPQRRFVSCRA